MRANPILRTATSLAVTVAFAYAACALLFWLPPGAAMSFVNALFHGLDFGKLQASGAAFDFGRFGYALVVITAWAFVVGAFFGFTNDWYGRGRGE